MAGEKLEPVTGAYGELIGYVQSNERGAGLLVYGTNDDSIGSARTISTAKILLHQSDNLGSQLRDKRAATWQGTSGRRQPGHSVLAAFIVTNVCKTTQIAGSAFHGIESSSCPRGRGCTLCAQQPSLSCSCHRPRFDRNADRTARRRAADRLCGHWQRPHLRWA